MLLGRLGACGERWREWEVTPLLAGWLGAPREGVLRITVSSSYKCPG
jgi:hypothetical protein